MRDWFTTELLLATLLATSFTCVGLLSLWASTSPRHWFVRTALVLAALTPFLLVPAYEPIAAFALQSVVVAGGIAAYRWRIGRRVPVPEHAGYITSVRAGGIRFSLSSLLLLMVLAAVVISIITKMPQLNFYAWSSVIIVGALCGLATFIAAWMFASPRKWLAWPIAVVLCIGLGAVLWGLDWFAYSIFKQGGWPPTGIISTAVTLAAIPEPPVLVWIFALPAIAILLVTTMLLWTAAFPAPNAERQRVNQRRRRGRFFARALFAMVLLMLVAFPLSILWKLLHPLAVPSPRLPSPNGYDDFVAAGRRAISGSPILNKMVDPKSTAELAAEVAKFSPVYDQIRLGLSRPCEVPVWPIDPKAPIVGFTFADIQSMRAVARALSREAELAQRHGRFRDAALSSVDAIRVGQASSRGGLIIHYLVGIAMEGIGQWSLHPAIAHLDADACRETVAALEQLERDREPLDAVFHRDRIYGENAWGWYGHLQILLNDLGDAYRDSLSATNLATSRTSAIARLLTMEIALRRYQLENNSFPRQLDELIPEYASIVPTDPWDVNARPLHYSPTSNGYLLYSVGFDGDDDAGRPSSRDVGWLDDGDLRLDSVFAPDEEAAVPTDDEATDEEADAPDVIDAAEPDNE